MANNKLRIMSWNIRNFGKESKITTTNAAKGLTKLRGKMNHAIEGLKPETRLKTFLSTFLDSTLETIIGTFSSSNLQFEHTSLNKSKITINEKDLKFAYKYVIDLGVNKKMSDLKIGPDKFPQEVYDYFIDVLPADDKRQLYDILKGIIELYKLMVTSTGGILVRAIVNVVEKYNFLDNEIRNPDKSKIPKVEAILAELSEVIETNERILSKLTLSDYTSEILQCFQNVSPDIFVLIEVNDSEGNSPKLGDDEQYTTMYKRGGKDSVMLLNMIRKLGDDYKSFCLIPPVYLGAVSGKDLEGICVYYNSKTLAFRGPNLWDKVMEHAVPIPGKSKKGNSKQDNIGTYSELYMNGSIYLNKGEIQEGYCLPIRKAENDRMEYEYAGQVLFNYHNGETILFGQHLARSNGALPTDLENKPVYGRPPLYTKFIHLSTKRTINLFSVHFNLVDITNSFTKAAFNQIALKQLTMVKEATPEKQPVIIMGDFNSDANKHEAYYDPLIGGPNARFGLGFKGADPKMQTHYNTLVKKAYLESDNIFNSGSFPTYNYVDGILDNVLYNKACKNASTWIYNPITGSSDKYANNQGYATKFIDPGSIKKPNGTGSELAASTLANIGDDVTVAHMTKIIGDIDDKSNLADTLKKQYNISDHLPIICDITL